MSLALQVAELSGDVNAVASACTEIFSCFVAVAKAMLLAETLAPDAGVLTEMSVTSKLTAAGTLTAACSLTLAVMVVL